MVLFISSPHDLPIFGLLQAVHDKVGAGQMQQLKSIVPGELRFELARIWVYCFVHTYLAAEKRDVFTMRCHQWPIQFLQLQCIETWRCGEKRWKVVYHQSPNSIANLIYLYCCKLGLNALWHLMSWLHWVPIVQHIFCYQSCIEDGHSESSELFGAEHPRQGDWWHRYQKHNKTSIKTK